jgi:outer membrane protein assembly factor BamA
VLAPVTRGVAVCLHVTRWETKDYGTRAACCDLVKRLFISTYALSLLCSSPLLAEEKEHKHEKPETEITPVPIFGGNSDIGPGGGVLVSAARVGPDYEPYYWRMEAATMTTFLPGDDGGVSIPYQNYHVMLHTPHVIKEKFDLRMRVSFTRESTLKYYGMGNRASVPSNVSLGDSRFEYEWTHPTAFVETVQPIVKPFEIEMGIRYTHNWLEVPANSKLAEDAQLGSPSDEFIGPLREHGVLTFSPGVALDTRDGAVAPTRGMHHTVRFDWSPGGVHELPFNHYRLSTIVRFYAPLGDDGSTFAVRGVADLLFGDPPIYEFARFEQTGAFGGPKGVRGVPGQRYHGKVKFFGNVEVRKNLFDFEFFSKTNKFGVAAFVDGGRLFADYEPRPELDGGKELGLKVGVGGGIRLQAGQSFVIRADAAWSPDARPVGVYLASGHLF